jgi:hypothetical protein
MTHEPSVALPGPSFWWRATLLVLARPRLWWTALQQARRLARPRWWARMLRGAEQAPAAAE